MPNRDASPYMATKGRCHGQRNQTRNTEARPVTRGGACGLGKAESVPVPPVLFHSYQIR